MRRSAFAPAAEPTGRRTWRAISAAIVGRAPAQADVVGEPAGERARHRARGALFRGRFGGDAPNRRWLYLPVGSLGRQSPEAAGRHTGFHAPVTFSDTSYSSWIRWMSSQLLARLRMRIGGGSYLSTGDPRLLMGLGPAGDVARRVTVRWPSGSTTTHEDLAVGRYWLVDEETASASPL